jgi:hypothetical protein
MADTQEKFTEGLGDDSVEEAPEDFLRKGKEHVFEEDGSRDGESSDDRQTPDMHTSVMHGPPALGPPALVSTPFPGRKGIESTRQSRSTPTTASGPRDVRVDDIVRIVTAQLYIKNGEKLDHSQIYDLARGRAQRASINTDVLQRRSGVVWGKDKIAVTFQAELLKLTEEAITGVYGSLGDKYVKGYTYEGPVTSNAGEGINANISGGIAGSVSTLGALGGGGGGEMTAVDIPEPETSLVWTRVNLVSYNRPNIGSLPNVFSIPFSLSTGLGITDYQIQKIRCVSLIEVCMNYSLDLTARGESNPFYIGIDEIDNAYNKQNDGFSTRAQFKCTAIPNLEGSDVKIRILTNKASFPYGVTSNGKFTIHLYDEQKNPLDVEQDVYALTGPVGFLVTDGVFIDDPGQQMIFQIAQHSFRNGDRVLFRGITCAIDNDLFGDSHKYKAQVVDLTHISVNCWRAGLAAVDIVLSGPQVICSNNVIRISLEIAHEI